MVVVIASSFRSSVWIETIPILSVGGTRVAGELPSLAASCSGARAGYLSPIVTWIVWPLANVAVISHSDPDWLGDFQLYWYMVPVQVKVVPVVGVPVSVLSSTGFEVVPASVAVKVTGCAS